MGRDKRRDSRGNVTVDSAGAMFFLRSRDGIYAITRVIDVSLSGAGIQTRYRLAPGETRHPEISRRRLPLVHTGHDRLVPEDDDSNCKLGISFDAQNRESNALFFLAMRKYLDEFDGLTMDA
jgi:hypothetical protein